MGCTIKKKQKPLVVGLKLMDNELFWTKALLYGRRSVDVTIPRRENSHESAQSRRIREFPLKLIRRITCELEIDSVAFLIENVTTSSLPPEPSEGERAEKRKPNVANR